MQIISQFAPLPLADPAKGTAVAMGYFDGIHIGHRAVIQGAVQWAKAHGAAPAVFTFRLPVENKMKGKRLLSTEDKHALIGSLGVAYYLTPDFEAIKALSPEQFVHGIVENCHAKALFCGENFTFGAKAAGTPELLRTLCAPLGVEVVVVPMAQFEEKPVSSTHIRALLEQGEMEQADAFLGHPHILTGPVLHGHRLGRTLGIPTANLAWPANLVVPRRGVYAVRVALDGHACTAVTNVGTRPTVSGQGINAETWLLDYTGDLYGREITLEFHKFLRPERKFASLEEMRREIQKNARQVREYFSPK